MKRFLNRLEAIVGSRVKITSSGEEPTKQVAHLPGRFNKGIGLLTHDTFSCSAYTSVLLQLYLRNAATPIPMRSSNGMESMNH